MKIWSFVIAAAIAAAFMMTRGSQRATDERTDSRDDDVVWDRSRYPQYPEQSEKIRVARKKFDDAYERTFDYTATAGMNGVDLVRRLFSLREDALIAMNDIRLRLPNDYDAEKRFVRSYESLDRELNELISDAKTRLNVFVHPGPMSSAYAARRYRAFNDRVT